MNRKLTLPLLFCLLITLAFLSYPKSTLAEIATVRDWIGLFPISNSTHLKSDSIAGWKYAGSCLPIPTVPKLEDLTGCNFTIPSNPTPAAYEYRLYANDQQTEEALITRSKFIQIPTAASAASCPFYIPTGFNPIVLDNTNPLAISGLLSVTDQSKRGTYSTVDKCVIGDKAVIPPFSLKSYDEMKSIYFSQNKSTSFTKSILSGDQTESFINLTGGTNQLYNIGGSLTIGGNLYPTIRVYKTAVVFIDGDLIINKNIDSTKNTAKESTGLVFVVSGNVNIDPSVTIIDANIMTYGTFCSIYDGNCITQEAEPLVVNGSVISLDSSKPPKFKRTNSDNLNPAEEINYVPKYLVIMKDIFSKDLNIWSEVTGWMPN